MNKFFKWTYGRQNSGYKKFTFFSSKKLRCDMHLLKFETGSFISMHLDPVEIGYDHYRLNIILKNAKKGGKFLISKCIFSNSRVKFFRPDEELHGVTLVTEGTRYVLSIGWVRRNV